MEKNIRKLSEEENKILREKLKTPLYLKLAKILVILIPLALLIYLVTYNLLIEQTFSEIYDIGSSKNYLSPVNRVSSAIIEGDLTYQNLTSQLVYFEVPVTRGADYIKYEIRFKDNFPEDGKMSLGARDKEEWSYKNELIYSKTLETLISKYPYQGDSSLILIKLNRNVPDYTINDIINGKAKARVASDRELFIPEYRIANYTPGDLVINESLRGTQKFYIYVKGDVNVEVKKRDLNWYNNNDTGEDRLEIILYDLSGRLISSSFIDDDGISDKKLNKNNTNIQQGYLYVPNLKEGIYRLELKNNEDMIITQIKLNQNKLIATDRVFLASSSVYFNDLDKSSSLYFKQSNNGTLYLKTYHEGVTNQLVSINNISKVMIEKVNEQYEIGFPGSNELYKLTSPKSDIIVTGQKIFSFSEESYFNPFVADQISYKDDIEYLEKNADYILIKYSPVKSDGDWKIAAIKFELIGLYINNDKLNMLINTPHLNEERNSTLYIPVDWIKINTHKPGRI
ncbi:MAG: hypothetical protein QXX91_03390 [Thermoplasmata archaeon]